MAARIHLAVWAPCTERVLVARCEPWVALRVTKRTATDRLTSVSCRRCVSMQKEHGMEVATVEQWDLAR